MFTIQYKEKRHWTVWVCRKKQDCKRKIGIMSKTSFSSFYLPSNPLQSDVHLGLTFGTYFMYSARSVARIALSIIFRVALYSSRERPLRIWFPWRVRQRRAGDYRIKHRKRHSNQLNMSPVLISTWVDTLFLTLSIWSAPESVFALMLSSHCVCVCVCICS